MATGVIFRSKAQLYLLGTHFVCAAVQAVDLAVDLDLPRDFGRPSGGSAQWVDRHGCRESRDGPWMARFGVPTERDWSEGHLSAARAVRGSQAFLLTFVAV